MPRYFFILGRNPELSLAELHAVLPTGYKALACSREVLVVECEELAVEKLMKRLGGTIKAGILLPQPDNGVRGKAHDPTSRSVARPFGSVAPVNSAGRRELFHALDIFQNHPKNKKLYLGLSVYALDSKARLPSVRELRELGIQAKRDLQAQGYRMRLVTSRDRTLSSVIVKKEKLLSQGSEIALFYSSSADLLGPIGPNRSSCFSPLFIGKTLAVQEFEEASLRDFGRPVREMKVGMLPIQLAKIMINLAHAPLDATVLDPFCGFGTILAEAALMGYRNLIGSDLEPRMVEATRKNINWLFCNFRQRRTGALVSLGLESQNSPKLQLITTPVQELSKHLPPHSVDAVVTEPYLGPTRSQLNPKSLILQLSELYIQSFKQFAQILKPGGRVGFIFPAFKHGTTLTKTSTAVLPQIKKMGFYPTNLLPSPYTIDPSPSIIYSRPSQSVLREIFVLEYKK